MDIFELLFPGIKHIYERYVKRNEIKTEVVTLLLQTLINIDNIVAQIDTPDSQSKIDYLNAHWMQMNEQLDKIESSIISHSNMRYFKRLKPYLDNLTDARRKCSKEILIKKHYDGEVNYQIYVEENPHLMNKFNYEYKQQLLYYLNEYKRLLDGILEC